MAKARTDRKRSRKLLPLEKCPTGIAGLDEVTNGGLPRGRTTLVCGGPGCGKTLMAMEFIIRGIRQFDEPGVFMAFEETPEELAANVASLGFDVKDLMDRGKLDIDFVHVERSEIEETGEYDLEGLFVRLGSMIAGVNAQRVAIDTIETLFGGLPNEGILRAELRRLFRWLKNQGVTTLITGEQGERTLTRNGLEEYVSDCVIFLDHRVQKQVATRRLRVIKYRGSSHGTNEYPTLIDRTGLSVLPVSSLGLTYPVSNELVCSGVKSLDTMLAGGYYKGSSVLISGTAGAGKSSLAASFADGICRKGQKCLYFLFEESPAQIKRNMRSIGLDLGRWERKGQLRFQAARPTLQGLESHLVRIHKTVEEFNPDVVVIDPITNLSTVGETLEVQTMLTRMIDYLKSRGTTAVLTSLTRAGGSLEQSDTEISSLIDTWLLLRMVESASERNRILYVLKSRGIAHSNQMREFLLTDNGIQLREVYVGPGEVYTGTARVSQEQRDIAQAQAAAGITARQQRELGLERTAIQAQLEALQVRLTSIGEDIQAARDLQQQQREQAQRQRRELERARKAE